MCGGLIKKFSLQDNKNQAQGRGLSQRDANHSQWRAACRSYIYVLIQLQSLRILLLCINLSDANYLDCIFRTGNKLKMIPASVDVSIPHLCPNFKFRHF